MKHYNAVIFCRCKDLEGILSDTVVIEQDLEHLSKKFIDAVCKTMIGLIGRKSPMIVADISIDDHLIMTMCAYYHGWTLPMTPYVEIFGIHRTTPNYGRATMICRKEL